MMSDQHNIFRYFAVKVTTAVIQVILLLSLSQLVLANDAIFIHAVKNNDADLIAYLAKSQTNIDLSDQSGKTALMVAAKAGNSTLVEQLLDQGAQADKTNNNGGSAVMFASIKGDLKTIGLLLQHHVDVNAKGSNGWGALMIASAKGHVEVVKLLLDYGVNVNTVDVYDWTPLHRASFENHLQVVELLLTDPRLQLDARDDKGATALHHAAIGGNHEITRSLIEKGASVRITDHDGRTAIDYAQKNGFDDLAQMLKHSTNDID